MEDDAMDIDESIPSGQIIIREPTGLQIIGGATTSEPQEATQPPSSPSTAEDVVVLDDDEEDMLPVKKKNKTDDAEKSAPQDVEIIDLVDTMRLGTRKCINYACTDGKELIAAPLFCLSFFRVNEASSQGGVKEVCTSCYDHCITDYDKYIAKLMEGQPIFQLDIPIRNDTVAIDDSDEEETGENSGPEMHPDDIRFCEENIALVLAETMKKLNFNSHVGDEMDFLTDKKDSLGDSIKTMQETLKETRKSLDSIQIHLYNQFRPDTVETGVLTIIDDHQLPRPAITSPQDAKNTTPSRVPQVATSSRKGARVPVMKKPLSGDVGENAENQAPVPMDLPLVEIVQKPSIHIDELCYIARNNSTNSWVKARLKASLPPGSLLDGKTCTSQLYKFIETKSNKERIVDGRKVAGLTYSKIRYDTGTRVIAAFNETAFHKQKITFYPGIVAEPPVALNRFRYLIFFDIGYSLYVNFRQVFQVLESSKNVWEDMIVSSQAFIKKYLESPERPMVKLHKGQSIRVEYRGKWEMCKILDVDCSLALVYFDNFKRKEWIYRGSTRLSPMYKEEINAQKNLHVGGANTKTDSVKADSKSLLMEHPPEGGRSVRAVARKSTARPESSATIFKPFLPPANENTQISAVEPTSKIMYYTPRDQVITQRIYKPHICSSACKDYVRHSISKLKGHNPLSKPLLCGWARITVKVRGRKEIAYKAPCGRMVRNMLEVHMYLRLTRSDMTVDLFDFNHNVRCLAEFSVECAPDPRDLSRGLEQVTIPVINGVNNKTLQFCNYSTKRTPMSDVPLNTDPEFLIGCDCTDDCADKSKCACFQLTMEGAKYMGKNVDPETVGYVYRRLHEQVLTGIYECNPRCKCGPTCLNRVVQNQMSIKLQVFMTQKKGWGIRCVNDVPQGTFICIYAGTIHTEHAANADGLTQGDEYFAELDYIENCERHKEDYESDVEEPESPRVRSATPEDDDEDDEEQKEYFGRRRRNVTEDNDFTLPYVTAKSMKSGSEGRWMRLRRRQEEEATKKNEKLAKREQQSQSSSVENVSNKIETVTISDEDDDPKEVLSFNPKTVDPEDEDQPKYPSVRRYFGEDEPYIMDTKNAGNIGRFLNHSCAPNVFVQNVFVDTHDLRFPWVAFFCSQFIRAGTELTWNYNYDIGSVPGRILLCHCGTLECKGRLL